MISAYLMGLGNPGKEYAQTRHNVGWLALDFLLADQAGAGAVASGVRWQTRPKLHAELAPISFKTAIGIKELLAIKPQTFMNDSGLAVQSIVSFFDKKLLATAKADQELKNIFVFHDDLDLQIGHWKLQLGTGPKIHNGLSSIYQHLGTKKFWHVRIGVDGRAGARTIPGHEYVLGKFSPTEYDQIQQVFTEIAGALLKKI